MHLRFFLCYLFLPTPAAMRLFATTGDSQKSATEHPSSTHDKPLKPRRSVTDREFGIKASIAIVLFFALFVGRAQDLFYYRWLVNILSPSHKDTKPSLASSVVSLEEQEQLPIETDGDLDEPSQPLIQPLPIPSIKQTLQEILTPVKFDLVVVVRKRDNKGDTHKLDEKQQQEVKTQVVGIVEALYGSLWNYIISKKAIEDNLPAAKISLEEKKRLIQDIMTSAKEQGFVEGNGFLEKMMASLQKKDISLFLPANLMPDDQASPQISLYGFLLLWQKLPNTTWKKGSDLLNRSFNQLRARLATSHGDSVTSWFDQEGKFITDRFLTA